jgi:flagellar biogenesis protein FliO
MIDMYISIIKVFFILLGMIAAMILLYRYAGKLKLNLKPKDTTYGLRKVDAVHLGYKKFVSVLEVKDYVLVIGVSEKEMSLLTQWKKEDSHI